ncbi:MAG: DUF58 domain-containing protein [Gemmatimonadaceae bacterium]|nr:DUF58 domain-containing protein [Gemmatimonadaceae bacterium]
MESTRTRADLLDPAQVASLGRMEIVARWVVEGFLQGLHRSPRKGFSVEFAEYRGYQPGDDLRYIDWKVVARADKWMIKQFEEETNLRAAIVLDVSKSMDWKGTATGLTKLQYAEQIVAAVSLLLLRQKDAVGLVRYDDQLRSVIPPKARTIHWRRIIGALEEPGGGGDSQMGAALMHAGRMVSRPGIVILVSDMLVDPEDTLSGLKAVRAGGHDVTVLHVMDRSERELDVANEAIFADTETPLHVSATASEVRDAYRRTVDHAIQEWRDRLGALGCSYEVVFSDEPFGVPLRKAFAARQRLP